MIVLDASVLIAHLDGTDAHHEAAREVLRAASGQTLGASVLTLAEVMVAPARAGRAAAVDEALAALRVQRLALAPDDAVALAELRASTGLRMPDCCVLLAVQATGSAVATFNRRLAADGGLGLETVG